MTAGYYKFYNVHRIGVDMETPSVLKMTAEEMVTDTIELFELLNNDKRHAWAERAREDEEFRFGKQWTAEQDAILRTRGQLPLVINRIDPAVELAKAVLTANNPTFRVVPVEDSDNQIAIALNGLLEYIWRVSDGKRQLARLVEDYVVKGMGCMIAYVDVTADGGRGEVKVKHINPLSVYIDPDSREDSCEDAAYMMVSRTYTKRQLLNIYPQYFTKIKDATGDLITDEIHTDAVTGVVEPVFEGSYNQLHEEDDEYIRGYERYDKIWIKQFRIFERWSHREIETDEDGIEEYMQRPAWIINDEIYTEENEAAKTTQQLLQEYQQQQQEYEQMLQAAEQDPQVAEMMIAQNIMPPTEPTVIKTNLRDIYENSDELIEIVSVPLQRIVMHVVVGDKLLYKRVLPCTEYPIVCIMNRHTGSPYPISDVSLVKDQQRFINKMKSLLIAHTTAATNVKVIVPTGSNVELIRQQWAQPSAIIEADFSEGIPQPVQPLPLPNELYTNIQQGKDDIEYQFGLFEAMMGSNNNAPDTARGIMMLDEFGQRRIKPKMETIERGLERLCEIVLSYVQTFYVSEKIFRILSPNNSLTEYAINRRLYDDAGVFTGTIENNVAIGRYDVYVQGGSMLPSNRAAQLAFYIEAYKEGLIDRVEVLKKTEIFDIEGVLQRIDYIEQLERTVQELQDQVGKLQGDMQTRERELFHTKLDNALTKEMANVQSTTKDMQRDQGLAKARLSDVVTNAAKAAQLEVEKIKLEEREKARTQAEIDKRKKK